MNKVGQDRRLNYYRQPADFVIAELKSHEMGLTNVEAARRFEQNGPNTLHRAHRDSVATTILRQFKSLFVIILLISAGFSLYLSDGRTATILVLIALINATVGFTQEYKAEKLLQDLEHLLVPRAKVFRNGSLKDIDSTELALGDIVYITEGDTVPADLRLIDEDELTTNDFALTGESNPSRKFVHAISSDVPLGSRHNLAFMSTTVATGNAHGIVIATGMHTELGRIASLSQVTTTDSSPLQKEMNNLAKRVAQGTLILAAVLAVVAINADLGVKAALLFAISIAAAMIPNGLVAEVNITLAQTASRMSKARALVRRLSAVETLGATNIILTDKTGTLTKNEMTVTSIAIGRDRYNISGTGYEPIGQILNDKNTTISSKSAGQMKLFFMAGAMACNAKVCQPDGQHSTWYVLGDPTEGAVVTLARKSGLNTEQLDKDYEEVKEFQFDSGRKIMSSVRHFDGQLAVFVKGAPEAIIERSVQLWDHGHIRKFTKNDHKYFIEYNETEANKSMRNLALAYRILPKNTNLKKLDMEKVEQNLIFLGLVSMHDPLREDVPAAMVAAQHAHVHVSVITGDYSTTAKAIALQAKLGGSHDEVTLVVGSELAALADSQILQLIQRGGAVFSRVSPEDKLRVVEIAKQSGQVVAVTGDGINDAPALKRADIGVAMGKTGTDVAKDAAEIVLLDDSFGTLVSAIEQGRLTFHNIRKAARCALTDNAGELLVILISLVGVTVFKVPMAITAIQILAIDIVAEMFPITALGWDKAQRKLMSDQPRQLKDHIINARAVKEFIMFGFLSAALAYLNYLFFFVRNGLSPVDIDVTSHLYAQATILTYLTMVLCQFINLLLVRSDEHEKFFTNYLWSNKKLLLAFGVSFFLIANIMYNPIVQPFLHSGPLSLSDWLTAVVAATIYLVIRMLQRHTRKHARHEVIKLHHEIHGQGSPAKI